MVGLTKITPTLPTTDINRSKDFYEKKLGLTPQVLPPEMADSALFSASDGSMIFLYTRGTSKADHTLASFNVTDLVKAVTELSAQGVVFEQYNMPGLTTDEMGIVGHGSTKSAWFKDPDGNILGLVQM